MNTILSYRGIGGVPPTKAADEFRNVAYPPERLMQVDLKNQLLAWTRKMEDYHCDRRGLEGDEARRHHGRWEPFSTKIAPILDNFLLSEPADTRIGVIGILYRIKAGLIEDSAHQTKRTLPPIDLVKVLMYEHPKVLWDYYDNEEAIDVKFVIAGIASALPHLSNSCSFLRSILGLDMTHLLLKLSRTQKYENISSHRKWLNDAFGNGASKAHPFTPLIRGVGTTRNYD